MILEDCIRSRCVVEEPENIGEELVDRLSALLWIRIQNLNSLFFAGNRFNQVAYLSKKKGHQYVRSLFLLRITTHYW